LSVLRMLLLGILATCAALHAQVAGFQDDLRERRAHLMELLDPDGMAIVFSAPRRTYSRDIEYRYRQDSNLYYLTGIEQDETTLVLMPGNESCKEMLFIKARNPEHEHWNGQVLSREEAASLTGIATVLIASEFESFVDSMLAGKPFEGLQSECRRFLEARKDGKAKVYLLLDPKAGYMEEGSPARMLAGRIKERFPSVTVEDATDFLRDLRQIKTKYEQRLLRESLQIACDAQLAGMKAIRQGVYEYEIAAAIEEVFLSRGAEGWAYPTIVGSGPNATILHYSRYTRKMVEGDLLLVDAGPNYRYLAGDITRTYPVGGKYSRLQKDIYSIVLEARDAGVKAAVPGARLTDIHASAVDVIKDGLYRLGLITEKSGDQYRAWFTHGSCHFIGIDVHDVGDDKRRLAPGMAFTIEPGIYVRPEALDALAQGTGKRDVVAQVRPKFDLYRDIGIRIEDSFLMTETGLECLSDGVPRTIEGIEANLK
jgi:Xaa-Pro aminopeptidase